MPELVELEIAFLLHDSAYCFIESRLSVPSENQLDAPQTARSPFPLAQLIEAKSDPPAYGQILTGLVFSDDCIRNHFLSARNESERRETPLRLRLRIDKTAQALHYCLWETLEDPERKTRLSTNQNIYFSRFLARNDFRQTKLRRKDSLTALIAVSSPVDVGPGKRYSTRAEVDFDAEVSRAKTNLGKLRPEVIPKETPLTLERLVQWTAKDPDILYLVCHGRFTNGEPELYLQQETGETDFVKGSFFAQKLSEQPHRPRLVVMISCNSAGPGLPPATDDDGVFSALGPPIADCGVPAVIAMQGNVTMATVERFMEAFFQQLNLDGQLDRAMSAARSVVQENADYFSPALFTRLVNGSLWYEPWAGMTDWDKWRVLETSIVNQNCTPILGSGLLEPLIGDTRPMASRLATQFGYPMGGENVEDLPQVCQFIETAQDTDTMQYAVRTEYVQQLIRRFAATIPEVLVNQTFDERLAQKALGREVPDLLEKCWRYLDTPKNPQAHRLLAKVRFPRYITTTPDNLLEKALVDAGRRPVDWKYDPEWMDMPPELIGYKANDSQPLLVHLFGSFDRPELLVWSEDNFFEYLINVEKQPAIAKAELTSTFATATFLFLGFHLQDWDFRVLLRSILSLEGSRHTKKKKKAHVAVQVDPSEARTFTQREQAKKYLEKYFENANITIFWGSVEDFLKELINRLQPAQLA